MQISTQMPANVIKLDVPTGTKLRIVLVEDNTDLRELTCELLEMRGCTVELAVDGVEGVSRIIASKPDLALVDIGLPELDGYGVARQVRSQLGAAIVLVAASGYGLEQDREEAYRAGFDLHVTKPLDEKALRAVLDHAQHAKSGQRSAT